jgi:uncharacterized protein YlxW (UPF0749 family)
LDALVESGDLQSKDFGKSTVYLLNQATLPDVDEKEIEKMSNKLNSTKKEWESHNEEVKDLNAMIKDLNSQLTNEEIVLEIKKYEKMVGYTTSCHDF